MATPSYIMATEMALNVTPAQRSLSALKQSVNIVTRGWQEQAKAQEAAGQSMAAAATRVNGLQAAIEKEQKVIDELTDKQQKAIEVARNRDEQLVSTKASIKATEEALAKLADTEGKASDAYKSKRQELLAYQQQERAIQRVDKTLRSTTASLAYQRGKMQDLQTQYQQATRAVSDYQSGLNSLKSAYQQQQALSSARIDRLQAEGRTIDALKAKSKNYADSVASLSQQLDLEKSKLRDMGGSSSGVDADALNKQKIAVEQTAAALARAKAGAAETNAEMRRVNPSTWDVVKSKILGVDAAQRQAASNVERIKGVFSGAALGSLVGQYLPSATGELKQIASEGQQVAAAGAAMEARWKNLGLAAGGIKQLTAQVGELKTNTNLSAQTVNNLQTRFYGMTNSVSKTKAITQGVASLSDQLKLSEQQANAFAGGLNRIESSGKVTASSLGRLQKQAPGLMSALQQASGMTQKKFQDLVSSGKMTADQFNAILARASQNYAQNAKAFDNSAAGSRHALEQQWKSTEAQIAKPLLQSQAQIFGQLRKSLANPDTQRGLVMLAKGFATLAVQSTKLLGVLAKRQAVIKPLAAGIASLVVSFKAMRAVTSIVMTLRLVQTTFLGTATAARTLRMVLAGGLIGVVVGLGVALFELYKHNARFHNFVNGIWRGIKSGLGKALNFTKHNWKQMALFLVNPLAGGFALLWKHVPAFRNFFKKTIPNAIRSGFGAIGKAAKRIVSAITAPFRAFFKWIQRGFDKVKSLTGRARSRAKHHAAGTSSVGSDELAVVNDSHDPHWQEAGAIDGHVVPFPAVRNLRMMIPAGMSIINGEDLHRMQSGDGARHYAAGSSSLESIMSGLNVSAAGSRGIATSEFMQKLNETFQKELATFRKNITDANNVFAQTRQKVLTTFANRQNKIAQSLAQSRANAQQSNAQKQQEAKQRHQEALQKAQQRLEEQLAKARQRQQEAQQKAQQRVQTALQKAQQRHDQATAKAKAAAKQRIDKANSSYKTRMAKAKTPKAKAAATKAHDKALTAAQASLNQRLAKADQTFATSKGRAQSSFSSSMQKAAQSAAKTTATANASFAKSTQSANSTMASSIQSAQQMMARTIAAAVQRSQQSTQTAIAARDKSLATANQTHNQKLYINNENIKRLNAWRASNISQLNQGYAEFAHGGFSSTPAIFGERGLEAAVPISAMEEGNAWAQIERIAAMYAGNGGRGGQTSGGQIVEAISGLLSAVQTLTERVDKMDRHVAAGQAAQVEATRHVQGYDKDKSFSDFSDSFHQAAAGNLIY